MPNWCYNHIDGVTKEVWEKYRTGVNFDFNKLIPMPERLENTVSGGRIKECMALYLLETLPMAKFKQALQDYHIYPSLLKTPKTKKEYRESLLAVIGDNPHMYQSELWVDREKEEVPAHTPEEIGEYYVTNIKETGFVDWYSWSNTNWDTKWNACDTCYDEERETLSFSTAWSVPVPIFRKLCAENPTVPFEFFCTYEDGGSRQGRNKNGRCTMRD